MDKQTPLRDNYVSCTEPVNPYHGNYVVVSLTKPYCLNLPSNVSSLWGIQSIGWDSIGLYSPGSLSAYPPQWKDLSRNFIMPTHCVRTWSNGSYWWNPSYYYDNYYALQPTSRAVQYPEPQIGDLMYMHAIMLGMAVYQMSSDVSGLKYSYSQYNYTYPTGDSYNREEGVEFSRPLYDIEPSSYLFINDYLTSSFQTSLSKIAGMNLTSYVVSFHHPQPSTCTVGPPCLTGFLDILIKPLVPYSDLSGCWLNPPANYISYMGQDWDGLYVLESKYGTQYHSGSSGEQLPVLPALKKSVSASTKCFDVVLPVQLYTLYPVNSSFTYSLHDVSNGAPSYNAPFSFTYAGVVESYVYNGYVFYEFVGDDTTQSGSFTVFEDMTVPVLLVGGGGHGGDVDSNDPAGGGGGGGSVGVGSLSFAKDEIYNFSVGSGAFSSSSISIPSTLSGPSVNETALGGGEGGNATSSWAGQSGGSGGGAGNGSVGGAAAGGSGLLMYYSNSGGASGGPGESGGGGGGASQVGASTTSYNGGNGGNGYTWINGKTYGGGGGGGGYFANGGSPGSGGTGGGGDATNTGNRGDAENGTGGGGAGATGGYSSSAYGGGGGGGAFVIAFPISGACNMEVVATRVRGTFWDDEGTPTSAGSASQVHFEILEPKQVFHLAHTFEESIGNANRPFYCTETNTLPIQSPASATTSLLFSPKCGPGIWTNLPQNSVL